MQKNQISPAIFQTFLESAANAADKGQAQYLTPQAWAEALSRPLPMFRPVIVDLHCGAGSLLAGVARGSTHALLGCDIDPGDPGGTGDPPVNEGYQPERSGVKFVNADVNRLYPLMVAAQFEADLFVLNPPWDLHQYRDPAAGLAASGLSTVRDAFAAHDGRCGPDTIDSTVAALCLALDRCSRCGEGFLIGNESTLQRLILEPGAPHHALADHVWSHLVIKGNICQSSPSTSTFCTGVLYFARDHDGGPPAPGGTLYIAPVIDGLEQCREVGDALKWKRHELRNGAEIRNTLKTENSVNRWQAVTGEWERVTRKDRPQWNLFLRSDGKIGTELSLFDEASERVTKEEAATLYELKDKYPMQLVMQRAHRLHLEKAAFGTIWRVDPQLQAAIRKAVEEYHQARAPLYPLDPIKRLGYLDEQEEITCVKDVMIGHRTVYRTDHGYKLRSATIAVKRSGQKLNTEGLYDDVEWDGQELAFFITDEYGSEQVFMEARLREENVRLSLLRPGERPGEQDERRLEKTAIDFTLQELVEHFMIPDVPDVARVNPEGYQRNLKLLEQIESLCGMTSMLNPLRDRPDEVRIAMAQLARCPRTYSPGGPGDGPMRMLRCIMEPGHPGSCQFTESFP